ncbi:hypothetical protein MKY98_26825 [Paenibacillus sp. FSL M8-0228]|jgi:membrane-associated HD superfamily phosphohydrolase|uniref:hypothetical protein n=1 Tax=Paenibacillus TaxID=44249 RepID=UPI00083E62D3|nr:hypothetical protein [Paenibacillus polymyxa]MBO3287552.1 hypothetical protein [Paenibacillus polymyxa]ODB54953.1 hypothetical protein A7311_20985 [Paenibacillus polymyxa]
MSSNIPDRAKPWVSIIVASIIIAVLLFATIRYFFYSSPDHETQKKANQPVKPPGRVHQYAAPDHSKQEEKKSIDATDMSQAQELIPLFLKTYIPLDVKQQPNSNIEKSKEYMTETFYKKVSVTQQRYTLDVKRRTVTNIELTPADIRQAVQWWDADIEVQQTDASGKVSTNYLLFVVKAKWENNAWKIDDVGVRTGEWSL